MHSSARGFGLLFLFACAAVASAGAERDRVFEQRAELLIQSAAQQIGAERVELGSAPHELREVTAKATQEVGQLLGQISELEFRVEQGELKLQPAIRDRLRLARIALESEPFHVPMTKALAKTLTGLSGSVVRASDSTPLQGVSVQAIDFTWGAPPTGSGIVASTSTDASGAYQLTLPPGTYLLRARSFGSVSPLGAAGYRPLAWPDLPCDDSLSCDSTVGTPIVIAAVSPVTGINFALQPAGGISGTIRRASDASPLQNVDVQVLSESGFTSGFAQTDASGAFQFLGLAPGRYRVFTRSASADIPGLMNALFGNRSCARLVTGATDCQFLPPDWVTVSAGAIVSGRDISLEANPGSIAGVVQDDLGAPLEGASVQLYSDDRYTFFGTVSGPGGTFSFDQLRPGTYRIFGSRRVDNANTHAAAFWPDVACAGGCSAADGDAVVVSAGASVTLPQPLALNRGSTIQGQIRDPATLAPIAGIEVFATGDLTGGGASTDASGNFTIRGLPAGTYYVYVSAGSTFTSLNYVTTYNGGATCARFFCGQLGTPVTLEASGPGAIATVNIEPAVGGQVSGVITDALTGRPVQRNRARLEVFDPATGVTVKQPFQADCTPPTELSPSTCSYTGRGFAPGAYRGVFATSSASGWIDTAFGGTPCPRGGCDLAPLPPLFITAGATLTGINGTLARGQLIRGRVTDASAADGALDCAAWSPVSDNNCSSVAFNTTLDNYAAFGQLDRAGNYATRTGFVPGTTLYGSTFLLRNNATFGGGYVDQAYNGLACPYGSCGITTGSGITVGATGTSGIDFALQPGASLTGIITRSTGGLPIPGVEVRAFNSAGRLAGVGRSSARGTWRIAGLSPGNYFVSTSNNQGFLNEVYNDLPCEPFCNPVGGSPIAVAGAGVIGGIDFALNAAASITGQVRLGVAPQSNVRVELYGAVGNLVRTTTSNASGAYGFAGLAAGRFYVRTRDDAGRADALWNGLPCLGSACNVRSGTPIDLAAGASRAGIDLVLASPASISGRVSRLPSSDPLSGVRVELLAPTGAIALAVNTDINGDYSFSGLPAGNYRLVTRNTPGLIDVAWPAAPCPAACSGLNGSAISVTAGAATTGRNFALDPGGSMSGSVRSAAPVAPLAGVALQVYNSGGVPVAQVLSNASGNYEVPALPTGNFVIRTQQSLGFSDVLFNNLPCVGYCDLLSGTPVPVLSGSGTGLIDFTLSGGLSVSGRVRDATTSAGIALARVTAFDIGGFVAASAQADASGNYTISGLRPGTYRLRTTNLSGYVNQIWNGTSCSPTPCLIAGGTPLALATNVSGIDFGLSRGASISGTATDTFNNPLPTGTAILFDSTGAEITSTPVTNGIWEFSGLANGTYFVLIRNASGLIDQLYDNVPCPAGACNIPASGTPIVLAATAAAKGTASGGAADIDLQLPPGQTISGTVRDAFNNAPLPEVIVYFFNSAGVEVGQATTNALGQYVSEGGLAPGSYRAATTNGQRRGAGDGFVNRLYSGVDCLLDCDFMAGTAINVAGAPVLGIDFSLSRAGPGMTGTVRDQMGNPLALITIRVFDAAGLLAGVAQTNSVGAYRLDGLPQGSYFARTANDFGFEDRLFGGGACGASCNPLSGLPIAVTSTSQTQNVDFTLGLPAALFSNGFEQAP
ncbi:MAG: carboxypeptidase regulatory-like domain-containing protein [Aquimonas sp.]|nr:carboxypeptidase regulatory-like domain-containing protein [Aquimonas sp.]